MLKRIYLAGFFLAWNAAITAYVNSSFLEGIVGVDTVGLVYTLGSLLTLLCIGIIPKIINSIGNRKMVLAISTISIGVLSLIIVLPPSILSVFCLMIYIMCNILLYFALDIFIEHYSEDCNTGKIRGTYLSLVNGAWLISPFLSSSIIEKYGFNGLYIFALVALVILNAIIFLSTRKYEDKKYERISFIKSIKALYANKPILRITILNFILQCFFAVMVIYSVIYMKEFHGLTWYSIGKILTVMLIPFVILSYPIGRLIDKGIVSEKRVIACGLLFMSVSVFLFARVPYGNVALLALCLFFSRVGAASLESANEMYFFKHINDGETHFLSLFRDTTPLAYTLVPIFSSVILKNYPLTILFTTLSICILCGYVLVPFLNYEKKN